MDKNNDILQESIDERIDAFIRGKMSKDEELVFKQDIQSNPELRNQVMATVSMIRGIREQGALQDKAIISKHDNSRVRSLMAWACSIAAVFAIFFAYSSDKGYNELASIVSPYYSEYSMSDISRGETDSAIVAHLYSIFNNIKEQRYVNKYIVELEPIYASLDKDFTYNAYANDIAWNLALAYIKDNQIEKAIPVLEKIETDNPDTPISSKAQKLLRAIKSR